MAGRLDRLILYVEQLGFLQTEIEVKGPKGDVERVEKSRMEGYRQSSATPPLPELPPGGDYLVEMLFSLSPIRPMPMGGIRPADWPEIWAFMQATGAAPEAWEAEALCRMCEAYCEGYHAGRNPLAISPMERDQS